MKNKVCLILCGIYQKVGCQIYKRKTVHYKEVMDYSCLKLEIGGLLPCNVTCCGVTFRVLCQVNFDYCSDVSVLLKSILWDFYREIRKFAQVAGCTIFELLSFNFFRGQAFPQTPLSLSLSLSLPPPYPFPDRNISERFGYNTLLSQVLRFLVAFVTSLLILHLELNLFTIN